jgi:hypothetical protein
MLCMFNFVIVVCVPFRVFCVWLCAVLLPPCVNPIAVKYICQHVNMSIFSKIMRENVSTECTYVLRLTQFEVAQSKACETLNCNVVPCWMKAQCKRVAEEHCWAITQAVVRSRYRLSGPGVLGFGFRLAILVTYTLLTTCALNSDLYQYFTNLLVA